MKKLLLWLEPLKKMSRSLLLLALVILSSASFAWSYHQGYTTTYNDSMAHLNIARQVIDNQEPGFYQLGSVWLPFNHILSLALVWNDWAWHSGFAGSFFSMVFYVLSSVALFFCLRLITRNEAASIIGAALFALNFNLLYLQTTPLTEVLYVGLFIFSLLAFLLYLQKNDPRYLAILGILGFFQVLTRYDGWFVVLTEGIILFSFDFYVKKLSFKETFGKLLFLSIPIVFGVGIWLLWNFIIFNNAFYFIYGPYSAHAQQESINTVSVLLAKGNLPMSLLSYWYIAKENLGSLVTLLTFFALIPFFFQKGLMLNKFEKIGFFILLLSPILFNVLALYLGFSIVNTPELNWNPSGKFSDQWFNVRYGILALPLAAIVIGILSSRKKIFAVIAVAVIVLQGFFFWKEEGIITLVDGTIGTSSFTNRDVAEALRLIAHPEDKILLSMSFFSPVAFESGFPLKSFIHEGVSKAWEASLDHPEDHARIVVMSRGGTTDPVYEATIENKRNAFLNFYTLAYQGNHANIYREKTDNEFFVIRDQSELVLGHASYDIKGVNSYDIAYQSPEDIEKSFAYLHESGANTVRFWMFGDGSPDGFQPKSGIINEERFQRADFVIAMAEKYQMKLIPVLVNNWNEYGGKKQYLRWTGKSELDEDLFFSDASIRNLFKNYVNKVLSRKNTVTGRSYTDEPAILAWDIMNEPNVKAPKQAALLEWIQDIANYVKTKDQNHLLMVGTETSLRASSEQKNPCELEIIDICSSHVYFYDDKKNKKYANYAAFIQSMVAEKEAGNKNEKPAIIGEIGVSKRMGFQGEEPLQVLKKSLHTFQENDFTGYLVWNWALKSDTTFGFSPQGDQAGKYSLEDLQLLFREEQ